MKPSPAQKKDPILGRLRSYEWFFTIALIAISIVFPMKLVSDPLKAKVVGAVCAVLFLLISLIAHKLREIVSGFNSEPRLSLFEMLTALITGRWPYTTGGYYRPLMQVRLVILCSTEDQTFAARIQKEQIAYSGIDSLIVTVDLDNESLFDSLASANAVCFVRGENTSDQTRAHCVLEEWAVANSHKPVIVLDSQKSEAYDWAFNRLPSESVGRVIPALLFRAIERGHLTRTQAAFNRFFSFLTTSCILLVFCALPLLVWTDRLRLPPAMKLDGNGLNDVHIKLVRSRSAISRMLDAYQANCRNLGQVPGCRDEGLRTTKADIDGALTQILNHMVHELRTEDKVTLSRLSLWRVDGLNGKRMVFSVANSGVRRPRQFPADPDQLRGSIVGGALSFSGFVFWRQKCVEGEVVAWDRNGLEVGECKEQKLLANGAEIRFNVIEDASRLNPPVIDDHRTAMLCFGQPDSDNGACAEVDNERDEKFLTTVEARSLLSKIVLMIDSIPTSLLESESIDMSRDRRK